MKDNVIKINVKILRSRYKHVSKLNASLCQEEKFRNDTIILIKGKDKIFIEVKWGMNSKIISHIIYPKSSSKYVDGNWVHKRQKLLSFILLKLKLYRHS